MKPLPPLSELNEVFYDDGVTLRWKKSPRYGIEIGDESGSLHPNGYIYVKYKQENYRAHRILWAMRTGGDPGDLEVDHFNRDRSDNSEDNLRLVNDSEQAHNRGSYCNSTTGITGVSRQGEKWVAYINHLGERKPLGRFNTKEEAAAARRAAEIIVRVV